jgi:hypothetical protein
MHVRTCPDCGEEFRPEIVRCSDCGAELVDHYEDGGPRAETPAEMGPDVAGPASVEAWASVFTSTSSEALREAAASLAAAAVRFRASATGVYLQLLVPADDYTRAAQALAGHDGAVVVTEAAVPEGHEAAACPACATPVPAGALECPECQLVVGGSEAPPVRGGSSDEQ